MRFLRREGQSIGEYAILIGIVLGAVFAVQGYIRNRIAGRVKAETDTYQADLQTALNEGFGRTTEQLAATIGTKSDSRSIADMDFDTAKKGTVQTSSKGKSTTTNVPTPITP